MDMLIYLHYSMLMTSVLVSEMRLTKGELTKAIKHSIRTTSPEHIIYFTELGAKIPTSLRLKALYMIANSPKVTVSQFINILGDYKLVDHLFRNLISSRKHR